MIARGSLAQVVAALLVVVCLYSCPVNGAFLPVSSSSLTSQENDHTVPRLATSLLPRQQRRASSLLEMVTSKEDSDVTVDDALELDVVLFGIGDLRTDDHGGIYEALSRVSQRSERCKILPLLILDDASLAQIPGAVAHTIDTAKMLVAAVTDLQQSLKENLSLDLQVITTSDSVEEALVKVVQEPLENGSSVQVHVCDLGDVDNGMGYGPYSSLQNSNLPDNLEVIPWTNHLREKPWEKVESVPDKYPVFAAEFATLEAPLPPISLDTAKGSLSTVKQFRSSSGNTQVPAVEDVVKRIQSSLGLDYNMLQAETNTGIYQTHWGGLDAASVGESQVLKNIDTYITDCQEDDALWVKHPQYVAKECPHNERSLEHATFSWFLKGTGKQPFPETNNLLAGEPMTRYLSAPLLFGTLSARRLWHASTRQRPYFVSPLKTLVEGREWHKLLAAKNLRTKKEFQQTGGSLGETHYGYWRWHGYLCRYAQSPLTSAATSSYDDKEGVLFIHGFGASGTQWSKAMKELSNIMEDDGSDQAGNLEGLAPDLLGFGECEKPAISYSIYVWDAQVTDFIKEVAVSKQKWGSYIVGGNSIGGFSAASTAANECARVDCGSVCSSGAPGTGRCRGVVLMNPAGPIQSREEVEKIEAQYGGDRSKLLTVAQVSAIGALPPCKPLARPVARVFGNGLLAYLRPRIQSICRNLYPTNPGAVDTALCDAIERDSLDPGAINVMISGAKLPPPRSMNEMLKADYGASSPETLERSVPEVAFDGPVLIATGVLDPLNDASARSQGLLALREGVDFDPINGGHCPHDELPKDIARSIARWMATTIRTSSPAVAKTPNPTTTGISK